MKFNIISHITTACNYDCSYCDVVKDNRNISWDTQQDMFYFIEKNIDYIERFKFFWGEPLLAKKKIIEFLDYFPKNNNFEIVTNTTLLDEAVCKKFQEQFTLIFFSIDSENNFDFVKNIDYINRYLLEKKLYFNIIIDPNNIQKSQEQFQKLYESWMRGYNILPVYFTKQWNTEQLKELSIFMKYVLDISLEDKTLRLYGFQENLWYDSSLINNSLFIDVDGKLYFSDFVSTFSGKTIKDKLYLWHVRDISLEKLQQYDFVNEKKALQSLQEKIYQKVVWQRQLHKIMDYFSEYLNKKNGK